MHTEATLVYELEPQGLCTIKPQGYEHWSHRGYHMRYEDEVDAEYKQKRDTFHDTYNESHTNNIQRHLHTYKERYILIHIQTLTELDG